MGTNGWELLIVAPTVSRLVWSSTSPDPLTVKFSPHRDETASQCKSAKDAPQSSLHGLDNCVPESKAGVLALGWLVSPTLLRVHRL